MYDSVMDADHVVAILDGVNVAMTLVASSCLCGGDVVAAMSSLSCEYVVSICPNP